MNTSPLTLPFYHKFTTSPPCITSKDHLLSTTTNPRPPPPIFNHSFSKIFTINTTLYPSFQFANSHNQTSFSQSLSFQDPYLFKFKHISHNLSSSQAFNSTNVVLNSLVAICKHDVVIGNSFKIFFGAHSYIVTLILEFYKFSELVSVFNKTLLYFAL